MKDVRCFKGEQSIDIRPLTLLVGENSGGKSTVLGCYHALLNVFSQHKLDFNIEPFEMGSFADIMRKDKNANTEFMIGMTDDFDRDSINYQFIFDQNEGDTSLRKIIIKFSSGGSFTIVINNNNNGGEAVTFRVEKATNSFVFEYQDIESYNFIEYFLLKIIPSIEQFKKEQPEDFLYLDHFIDRKIALITGLQEILSARQALDILKKCLSPIENFVGISPIRSKPQRTYNPFSGQAHSEGDEVPLFMRRLIRTNEEAWEYLHQELVNFGEKSGMFKDIRIKTFNDDMSDPFQIQIKHAEYYVNIMDVGYGVSQILPILVKMIMDKHNKENRSFPTSKSFNPDISTRFLLQEPELHLHPQAQAAFGSLLVHFAENGKGQNFLVETHSDFIVDRISTEIRDKKISPENVSLVYHEIKKGYVQLHNIEFDKMGNVTNSPNGYREFFTGEINKVLGF